MSATAAAITLHIRMIIPWRALFAMMRGRLVSGRVAKNTPSAAR